MKSSIFAVCLLLIFKHTGNAYEMPQWETVFTNGSSHVLLPCSQVGSKNVTWKFAPASATERNKTCTVSQPKGKCAFSELPNIKLADPDGYKAGNFSISFKAPYQYAGLYSCILDERRTPTKIFNLIHIKVSVTPAKVISPGESVNLILQTSNESYFQSVNWNIAQNPVKGGGVEIQWKKDGGLIVASSRHKFDYRSLNISQFKQSDEGRYVFTIKHNRAAAFYSNKLKITEATSTTPTVSTTRSDATSTTTTVSTRPSEATSTTPTVSTRPSGQKRNPLLITSVLLVSLGIIIAVVLLIYFTKIKRKPKDPEPAQNEDSDVVYTEVKLDAVPKSEPGATQSPEATIYVEIKTSPSVQPTEELSVL